MLVAVTQSDIRFGKVGDCRRHPVAIALQRATGRKWRVERRVAYPDGPKPVTLPAPVVQFIDQLDDGKHVTPISFELRQ